MKNKSLKKRVKDKVGRLQDRRTSSHSWFALKYILGLSECENYYGEWSRIAL